MTNSALARLHAERLQAVHDRFQSLPEHIQSNSELVKLFKVHVDVAESIYSESQIPELPADHPEIPKDQESFFIARSSLNAADMFISAFLIKEFSAMLGIWRAAAQNAFGDSRRGATIRYETIRALAESKSETTDFNKDWEVAELSALADQCATLINEIVDDARYLRVSIAKFQTKPDTQSWGLILISVVLATAVVGSIVYLTFP